MKRLPILITLMVMASLLLTGCGGVLVNNWPGLSVDQTNVYLSYQGAVYAINASNGAKAWNFPTEPDQSKPFYAPPAITEDGSIVVGNYGATLYALDTSGRETGRFVIEGGNFVATPLVLEDTVLAPSSNDILYALDRSLQNVKWTFKSPNMLWAQPASDGELVFLPALDHHLYALNLSDGSQAWSTDLGSALQSSPTLGEDGVLYIADMLGEVVAVNAENGEIMWRTPTGASVWSAPLLHEGTLYVGNNGGKVNAISAEDGSVVWTKDTGSPVIGGGALIPDGVIFATEGGSLIAYRFADGSLLWDPAPSVNGKLYTTPVVAGNSIVVAVTEGDKQLQAFGLDGKPSWPWSVQ